MTLQNLNPKQKAEIRSRLELANSLLKSALDSANQDDFKNAVRLLNESSDTLYPINAEILAAEIQDEYEDG